MTALTLTGTVTQVDLVRHVDRERTLYGKSEYPLSLALSIQLDGDPSAPGEPYSVRASVGVGRHSAGGDGLAFHDGDYSRWGEFEARDPAGWPLVIHGNGAVVRSLDPDRFRAACVTTTILPTVWRGDRVTVRGSLDHTGRRLTRMRLLALDRDGLRWEAGVAPAAAATAVA